MGARAGLRPPGNPGEAHFHSGPGRGISDGGLNQVLGFSGFLVFCKGGRRLRGARRPRALYVHDDAFTLQHSYMVMRSYSHCVLFESAGGPLKRGRKGPKSCFWGPEKGHLDYADLVFCTFHYAFSLRCLVLFGLQGPNRVFSNSGPILSPSHFFYIPK